MRPGEILLAWFQPDLDSQLRFSEGLIALTDQRLLDCRMPPQSDPSSGLGIRSEATGACKVWELDDRSELHARDRAGLGTLELLSDGTVASTWRYTLSQQNGVRRLLDAFGKRRADEDPTVEVSEPALCPDCGTQLATPEASCPACTATPPLLASPLLRLARFARPRAGMVILGFLLALASTAAGLAPPYITMPLLDRVLVPYQNGQPVDFGLVPWYLGALLAAAILAWLLAWGRSYVLAWVSERIAADLRNATYAHLQRLSLEFFGGRRTGDLMSRLGADTDRICSYLSDSLVDFGADLLMIVGTAAVLVSIDPFLAIATLVPFPVIAWMVFQVRGKLRRGFQRSGRAWAEMTSVLADTIPGIRVVKAFAQEQREVERYRRSNDRILQANDRVNATWTFFWPLAALLSQIGLLVVWAFGAYEVYHHKITVGVLSAFLAYIGRFYIRLESMSRMVQLTQRAGSSAQRIFEILDRVPSVPEPARPIPARNIQGSIEFRNVGFRHGNRKILDGINLSIRNGEMIGLVGPSGAGKSTLVNLVCRFYDVAEGAILVDGTDVRSYAISDYRKHIGLVLQEPFLFFGTVAENIAYGKPDATREQIVAAARAARCHEFILRLADGYDSIVGERGQSLSGGERQRISIARALLIDPRILILDEATSSVDTETEREIQEALDNLIRGRTTIAIAHRLSTLRKADRLVVLEKGRIAEVGQHHQLLQTPDGAYSRLHKAQLELAGVAE
ncbi:MAG: ABC transporter ATP-binding protein [Isosphaeraceae bacterium]